MFGRKLRAKIATDNGRSAEFVRKRSYENKQRCFECGDEGHLSYKCPVNVLGEREPPVRKGAAADRRRDRSKLGDEDDDVGHQSNYSTELPRESSLGQSSLLGSTSCLDESSSKRPRIKQSAYFSDDEELVDSD